MQRAAGFFLRRSWKGRDVFAVGGDVKALLHTDSADWRRCPDAWDNGTERFTLRRVTGNHDAIVGSQEQQFVRRWGPRRKLSAGDGYFPLPSWAREWPDENVVCGGRFGEPQEYESCFRHELGTRCGNDRRVVCGCACLDIFRSGDRIP